MPVKLIWALALCAVAASGEAQRPEVQRRTLEEPTTIQGYPCSRGYAWFYVEGGMRSCRVASDVPFGEATVPQGSWIHLTLSGKPDFVFLSRDWKVGEYSCRGGGHDYMTTFYPSGRLKLCWLAADTEVDGVPCMRASFWADVFGGGVGTYLHENGRLKRCKLSREFRFEGKTHGRGDHVSFGEGR